MSPLFRKKEMIKYKTNKRAIWEEYPIRVILDYELDEYEQDYNCSHIIRRNNKRIVPIVIMALNEGECNSTGVCGYCILDLVEKVRKRNKDETRRNR